MSLKSELITALNREIIEVEALEENVKKKNKYKVWERGYFTGLKLGLKTALRMVKKNNG